jgi:DNA sulfur modification protein DndD
MIITEVKINNFRIYKNENSINLAPENGKNISVVSGKNGFGKTTFLMSLVWCLYGKQMAKVDEFYKKEIGDKGGYYKYIGNSLNSLSRTEGESKFSVSITFTGLKADEFECEEVIVTREFDTVTSTDDKIEILIDGQPNELFDDLSKDNQSGEEIFVREYILPLEIAKFFFFDAEKIVSLAEANTSEQRRVLSKAYSEVLGIHKYEELRERLEGIQDDYRKKAATPEERKEFNSVETQIKNTNLDLEALENEKEVFQEEKSLKKYESDQIQEKLIKEKNQITLEEMNRLRDEEEILGRELNEIHNGQKELFDLIPFALAGNTLAEISDHLELEKGARKLDYQNENIDQKINDILVDLEREKQESDVIFNNIPIKEFYETRFKTLIKKHFFNNEETIPSNFKTLHDFSDAETNELEALINNLKHSFKEKFINLTSNYNQTKSKIDGIRRRLRQAEKDADDAFIKDLRDKKEALDKRIISIETKTEEINKKIGGLLQDLKSLRQRKENLRKKLDVSDQNKKHDKKIAKMISNLKDFIVLFKEEKKKSLEKNIKEGLNTFMHKEGFISRVEVTISVSGEDVEINLFTQVNEKEQKLDKGSLSMGERQMYASALLKALVEESDIEFPVFIDSPMQKFDKEHAENIIKYFYPEVSEQVIILPLIHKELTSNEYDLLLKNVNKAYLIHNESKHSSGFIETDVRELITKYDELYVSPN